ncbi:MAG: GAF domain-containing protein [Flavobacteriaceae bacterium]|jgi:GAF domain-containing protein
MYDQLLEDIERFLAQKPNRTEGLSFICELLHRKVEKYSWVGYYLHSKEKPELVLATYQGAPTEHTHIPFGKGICGQVALSNQNFIVDDVNAQENYIACSLDVKSEIVIPLIVNGENIGQIDIDGHAIAAFNKNDASFLKKVNRLVALHLF